MTFDALTNQDGSRLSRRQTTIADGEPQSFNGMAFLGLPRTAPSPLGLLLILVAAYGAYVLRVMLRDQQPAMIEP